MNGKLILVLGLQIVSVYGQPIFNPMAGHVGAPMPMAGAVGGHFGLPMDALGAASGYAGGGAGGFPLLSPMELNAIMEAQSRGVGVGVGASFNKAAFAPDTEPQGYAGFASAGGNGNGFMPSFEDGFANDGNSDFYEAPHHGEPFPAQEAYDQGKQPEPKGRDNRDNRGPYHKDDAIENGPSEPAEPQEPREEEVVGAGRGGEGDEHQQQQQQHHHPGHHHHAHHPGQRGGYRDEERDSGEPQQHHQNEPASGGAYREYRGEGGESSHGGGHPRQRGGYRDEERESGEPQQHHQHNQPAEPSSGGGGAYREYKGEGGLASADGPSSGIEGSEGHEGGPESYAERPRGEDNNNNNNYNYNY